MKVLITGACGFVGHWVAEALLSHLPNVQLIGFDNLSRSGSESNRQHLQSMGVELVHGDLRCSSDLDALTAVDWVIDCAALPSVLAGTAGNTSPRQLVEHNLSGSLNLLEYCRRSDAGLILLSTSRVYSIRQLAGLPLKCLDDAFVLDPEGTLPPGISTDGIDETFSTTPPISLYGSTKLATETMAWEYSEAFGFPLRINRCGVLAGSGQFGRADQGIFSFWIHSYLGRRSLRYIGFDGKGHQVRDCLHPWDVALLVIKQIETGSDPSKPVIANVSGGIDSAHSLRQLSEWCHENLGEHDVASSKEQRPFDLPWVVLDSRLAQEAWDWQPTMDATSILEEIAEHARANPYWLDLA
ncbi:NAD-dependent epimerase/dehydratase family protein [Aporhodopirellula aestuarii]|uniref:NAD-dependent epimerase/dehydratase family protein n=1 Tax=Aporhodopirellula aestuarii TaxID=2950107 RepID=A0ABT0U9P6_9BACT|nr:NAD-dependent epimerase/dehydratase family protein [Aporhodopirellula aestuarii]MCM2373255.1 NAD-dependent epimerase/dehydratase family protein [Aporhodopirellula aestuarii]